MRDVRTAVQKFHEDAASAVEILQIEINRAIDWIEHDRPAYWAGQVRRAFDKMAETRTQLTTCEMRTVAGRRPSCIEEKIACEKARRRLQFCREQTEQIRRWAVKIHHEANEFRGRVAGLRRCLDADVPRLIALLERTLQTLETYADIAPPIEDEPPA